MAAACIYFFKCLRNIFQSQKACYPKLTVTAKVDGHWSSRSVIGQSEQSFEIKLDGQKNLNWTLIMGLTGCQIDEKLSACENGRSWNQKENLPKWQKSISFLTWLDILKDEESASKTPTVFIDLKWPSILKCIYRNAQPFVHITGSKRFGWN